MALEQNMQKTATLALVFTFGLANAGCMFKHVISGPPTPKALAVTAQSDTYVMKEIANFYAGKCLQEDNPQPGAASDKSNRTSNVTTSCGTDQKTDREKRDEIMYDLKSIIDHNYDSYARNFQQTADTVSFGGEVSSAALSAVGTVVGATALKDILSTAATLTTSTTVSVQKNYFQKQSEYAILASMDAGRLQEWSDIAKLLKENDVNTYSLSQGLNDLLEYRRLGTAVAALTTIEQTAGSQSQQSKKEIQDTANSEQKSKPPKNP